MAKIRGSICFIAVVVGTGCSPAPPNESDAPSTGNRPGTLQLGLTLSPGLDVDRVDYVVSGNGQSLSDHIDLIDPNSAPSALIHLPAGSGYGVSMSAVATNGVHCAGSATFGVSAGVTSTVFVTLLCDPQNAGDDLGGEIINGVFVPGAPASCPDVAFYAAAPLLVDVRGGVIHLQGAGTAGTVAASWSDFPPSAGSFANGSSPNDTFVCNPAGPGEVVWLTLTVTDGKSCVDTAIVTVVCNREGTCSDGVIEAGEQCDDGNLFNGDGCSVECQIETVGECGDGTINVGEQCDDGNTVNGDGCGSFCYIETGLPCGNGIIDLGEQCDPPNTQYCDSACLLGGICTTCEEAMCNGPSIHTACTDGPSGDLCVAALECSRLHSCYAQDPSICYCGATDLVACQTTGGPTGPCTAEYEAAAGTTSAPDVLLSLTDPASPLGAAGIMLQCDITFCASDCL